MSEHDERDGRERREGRDGDEAPGTGGRGAKDSPREMERMNDWLDRVCAALAVDRSALAQVTPELLRLIGDVAHGPSRPAAPLTAFVLGVAAAREGDLAGGVAEHAAVVRALLAAGAPDEASDGPSDGPSDGTSGDAS